MNRPTDPPGGGHEPPSSQEDVIAAVLSDLGRRLAIVRRAAERAARQEGPAADAVRATRDRVGGMIDAVRGALPGRAADDGGDRRRAD